MFFLGYFTTPPFIPLSEGDKGGGEFSMPPTHRITSINKMNIPIQLNYCTRTIGEKGKFFLSLTVNEGLIYCFTNVRKRTNTKRYVYTQ